MKSREKPALDCVVQKFLEIHMIPPFLFQYTMCVLCMFMACVCSFLIFSYCIQYCWYLCTLAAVRRNCTSVNRRGLFVCLKPKKKRKNWAKWEVFMKMLNEDISGRLPLKTDVISADVWVFFPPSCQHLICKHNLFHMKLFTASVRYLNVISSFQIYPIFVRIVLSA